MSRITAAFRVLLGGMADDREAAYTEARRKIERLWELVHTLNAQRTKERAKVAALVDEVHALEDAAAVRDARLREMAAEMRDCDGNSGGWRSACEVYLAKYADILTPADDE